MNTEDKTSNLENIVDNSSYVEDTADNTSNAEDTAQIMDYSHTQIITYSDNNTETIISKNKLTKTATIEITSHIEPPQYEGANKSKVYEFTTYMSGGLLQISFFNETARNEFKNQVEIWNSQEYSIQDNSPPDQTEENPTNNPIEGFTVSKVTHHILELGTDDWISDTVISGPEKEDIDMRINKIS